MNKILLFAVMAFVGVGCSKDDETSMPDEVVISGQQYEVRSAKYSDGFYDFIGEDCVCLHLELTQNGVNDGAGMTIEISKTLLGRKVLIEPSDDFWFFHVGTGSASVSLESTFAAGKFGLRGGWFSVDYGDEPDEIIFEWELTNNSGTAITSKGRIEMVFCKQ